MGELQPRPATAGDVPGIARCVEAAYTPYIERIGEPPGPMLDDYRQIVRDHRVFVIESGGGIVGAIVLKEERGSILLDNVAVLPSRHGEGIGRRLMLHAEEEARRLGYASIDLYTHELMVENFALYARNGYEEVERRIERGFPRIYMRKRL
ncbi:MAG: GNAT family N-acetyltransferase [Alphaproteobacteria bacterium]|nr:GNAT family N-acetyltransferase [Alphaproteobacteria bacterium]